MGQPCSRNAFLYFYIKYLMPKQTPALPPSQHILPCAITRQSHSFPSQVSAGKGALVGPISIALNTPTPQLCRQEHPQPRAAVSR